MSFAQQMRSALEPMQRAVVLSEHMASDPEFVAEATRIAAAAEASAFASRGQTIGGSWGDKTFVQSGRLRASLSDPNAIVVIRAAGRLAFVSRVPYAKYHARQLYGWRPEDSRTIAQAAATRLGSVARGES